MERVGSSTGNKSGWVPDICLKGLLYPTGFPGDLKHVWGKVELRKTKMIDVNFRKTEFLLTLREKQVFLENILKCPSDAYWTSK